MNDLKIINEENFDTRFPKLNESLFNDMDNNMKETYLEIYSIYRKLFSEYIIDKLQIKNYDFELTNSNLNFVKVIEKDMDIYQNFNKEILNYFYIRNNLYIERLTPSERKILYTKFLSGDYSLDENTKVIIENSYKRIIFEDVHKDGSNCYINMGPDNSDYYVPNQSIVIGFRYDEFNLNNLSDEQWDNLHDKQLLYLSEFLLKMSKEISSKVNIPIQVIKYNEYSVKKKIIFENNDKYYK